MSAEADTIAAPSSGTMQQQPLITVRDLVKYFPIRKGVFSQQVGQVHAVDGVSFTVMPASTYALVGESGCGKTTTGRTMLRLIEPTSGSVLFDGQDVFSLHGQALRTARRDMQIIFQDPYSSLNPRMSVRDIIAEGLRVHNIGSRTEQDDRVAELLKTVGLAGEYAFRYPHEFSGGQRQRIGIARALALAPKFIVCDEAVSALDVSIQAQVINLLQELQQTRNIAYLFISHDLSVVRHISHRVGVMYLGQLVEEADTDALFENPLHPYTKALLSAIPQIDSDSGGIKKRQALTGDVPRADRPPAGCRFHPRCPVACDKCRSGIIPVCTPESGRRVQCVLYA